MLERYVINKVSFRKTFVDENLDKLTDTYVKILTFLCHVAASHRKHISEKSCETAHCALQSLTFNEGYYDVIQIYITSLNIRNT